MVNAKLPASPSKGVYRAHSGARRVVKPFRNVGMSAVATPREDDGEAIRLHHTSLPSHPQSRGLNGRTGHLHTMQLNHAEMQDCLSWCADAVQPPVWQRRPKSPPRLPVMGLAAKAFLGSAKV